MRCHNRYALKNPRLGSCCCVRSLNDTCVPPFILKKAIDGQSSDGSVVICLGFLEEIIRRYWCILFRVQGISFWINSQIVMRIYRSYQMIICTDTFSTFIVSFRNFRNTWWQVSGCSLQKLWRRLLRVRRHRLRRHQRNPLRPLPHLRLRLHPRPHRRQQHLRAQFGPGRCAC